MRAAALIAALIGIIAGGEAKAQPANVGSASYTLTDRYAYEPSSDGAGDADTATFTITLNLDVFQGNATMRKFYFNFSSTDQDPATGFGSRHSSTQDGDLAAGNANADFRLSMEYTERISRNTVEVVIPHSSSTLFIANVPDAEGIFEEVYTVHLTPTHDNTNEEKEYVLFGYRVEFLIPPDGDPLGNNLVDGDPATAPAITIFDLPIVTLTRNQSSVTESESTAGIFTLALTDAPDGTATVTYKIEVTGNAGDISATFGGDAVGTPNTSGAMDTFTMNVMNLKGNANADGNAAATLTIIPQSDDDADNETVTLTIISVEFPGLTFGPDDIECGNCNSSNGNNALTINIRDAGSPAIPVRLRIRTFLEGALQ